VIDCISINNSSPNPQFQGIQPRERSPDTIHIDDCATGQVPPGRGRPTAAACVCVWDKLVGHNCCRSAGEEWPPMPRALEALPVERSAPEPLDSRRGPSTVHENARTRASMDLPRLPFPRADRPAGQAPMDAALRPGQLPPSAESIPERDTPHARDTGEGEAEESPKGRGTGAPQRKPPDDPSGRSARRCGRLSRSRNLCKRLINMFSAL
jgi:hypothetical protein